MKDFVGRNAFITGAANGIGLAAARALAVRGVNVAMADIEAATLEAAACEVRALGVKVVALPFDVSDAAAVDRAADTAWAELGPIHLLLNNAGVTLRPTPLLDVGQEKWDWLLGVNVFGVIHCLRAFVPRMKAHGEGGHIVNTASIVGMQVNPFLRNIPYKMTKAALISMTENLELEFELAASGIGVSVFCPALVTTSITNSSFRRPARFGGAFDNTPLVALAPFKDVPAGVSAAFAGGLIVNAIENDVFFVFTHDAVRSWMGERHGLIEAGFAALAAYEARTGSVPASEPPLDQA